MWTVLEEEEKEEEEDNEQEEEKEEETTSTWDNLKEGTKCMLNYSLQKREGVEKECEDRTTQIFINLRKSINTEIEEVEGKS